MMDNVLEYLDRKEVRQRILEVYTEGHAENWQKNGTPEWVARDMVGLVKDTPELVYVVLFNIEFLEELVFERKVDPSRVIFMADCVDEATVSTGVYGVRTMVLPQEIRDPKKTIEFVKEKLCNVLYEGGPMPKTNNLVVFGNPPYQQEDGGHSKSAKPIYHLFTQAVVSLNPRFHSFIIPSRWMLGGKGLDSFREWMLGGAPSYKGDTKKHISKVVDFLEAKEVFTDAKIAGGVCYYLWDREHDGMCEYAGRIRKMDEFDVFIRDNIGLDIVHKVLYHHKGQFMDKVASASKPYGFRADAVPTATGTPCWFKQSQGKLFVDPAIVKDPRGDLGKWKVLAPRASVATAGGGFVSKIFVNSSLQIAAPGECCSETYIVLRSFNSEDEALAFKGYALTKFFGFLMLVRMASADIPSDKYSWVPDLGSYATAPTDEQLYKQFGLTQEEIKHIESRIK